MPKNITSVTWSASNIPSGVSFNAQTGVFSGTPIAEGTYTVPVHVETNYGEDTKNVKIRVGNSSSYILKAAGNQAQKLTENGNGSQDEYGFYSITTVHDPIQLTRLNNSFGVKTTSNTWYIGGITTGLTIKFFEECADNGIEFLGQPPVALPISDIETMVSGNVEESVPYTYVMYQKTDGELHIGYLKRPAYSETNPQDPYYAYATYQNGIMMPKGYGVVGSATFYVQANGSNCLYFPYWTTTTEGKAYQRLVSKSFSAEDLAKIKSIWGVGGLCFYLTSDGELWQWGYSAKTNICSGVGKIKDFWITSAGTSSNTEQGITTIKIFVLTEDNLLYAKGNNYAYQLGLPVEKTYTDFTLVGEYDVKRIEPNTLMLTNEGKLYHTNTYGNSINTMSRLTGKHSGFTHIFPDWRFQDICYASPELLVAITKE